MNENLKDILSHLNPEVDQETLLKYLEGHLSPEKQHEVERTLVDDEFEADAVEGLQNIRDKSHLSAIVDQLNRELKKKTAKKNKWRIRQEPKLEAWLLFAIVIILLLVIIGFFVIYRMKR